jgi:hypothetical protein
VAKEYGIPLAEARGGGGGSGKGQLFGRGITRAPASRAAPSTGAGGVTGAVSPTKRSVRRLVHRAGASARTRRDRDRAEVVAAVASRVAAPSRPLAAAGTGIVWMLGVAVLVLALGGLGAVVLGRYGRRASARAS